MPHPVIRSNHSPGRTGRQATTDDRVSRFWDRDLEALKKQGVKPPEDRWYVLRIERFIEAANGRRLTAHRAADVETQLRDLGASGGLSGWQFRQAVDAIQILFLPRARSALVRVGGLEFLEE